MRERERRKGTYRRSPSSTAAPLPQWPYDQMSPGITLARSHRKSFIMQFFHHLFFFLFFLFDVSYDCSLVERISPSFLTRHLVPTRLPLPASIIHHDAFGNICFSLKNHATGARESPPQQHETLVLDQQDNSSRVPFTKKTSRAIFTCVFFLYKFFYLLHYIAAGSSRVVAAISVH